MKLVSQKNNRAASAIEYVILLIMFLAAILLMQKQIARTFFGRWKDMGDTFGYGELYDPHATLECGRYVPHTPTGWGNELWYREDCYECCMDETGSCADFQVLDGHNEDYCRGLSDDLSKRDCCARGCDMTEECILEP